jgi:HEAT repeat protein
MSSTAVLWLCVAPFALLAGCGTAPNSPAVITPAPVSAVALRDIDYSGDQSALNALDREVAAAGQDGAAIATLIGRLTALLRAGETSTAARQAICQRLGLLFAAVPPNADTLGVFASLLVTEGESDFARLALEPAPGSAVDQILIQSMAQASGRVRLGLIQTLGRRAPPEAVTGLAALLRDTDPQMAAAAAFALGRIGGGPALAALRSAPLSTATFGATLACLDRLPTAEAQMLLRELAADARLAAPERAAVIRRQLHHDSAAAPARIAELLASPEAEMCAVGLEQIGTTSGARVSTHLAEVFPMLAGSVQAAALTALARRADVSAIPLLVSSSRHQDPVVRAAAITSLGFQPGDPALVSVLGDLSLTADANDARLARAALTRLRGPAVTGAVLTRAETGQPPLRAVFIEQIAARHIPDGLTLLRHCREDRDTGVRLAALAALGELAPPSDQALLIAWTLAAPSDEERARALRSLARITERNPDAAGRTLPVFAAIEQSPPATAINLLPILSRLGGRESADCAARLALAADPALGDRALATLARWPDASAQTALVTVAAATASPIRRAAAIEAALAYYERHREPWLEADTERTARLLGLSQDPGVRLRLVSLLRRAADPAAAVLARKLQDEDGVAAGARAASGFIAANLAGPPVVRVSKNQEAASRIIDGSTATAWAAVVTPDLWLEFDFRRPRPMQRLTFDQTGRAAEYPEKLEIYVTDDLEHPGLPVATAGGQSGRTVIELPPDTRGRYLIVKNTAERLSAMWSICELFID